MPKAPFVLSRLAFMQSQQNGYTQALSDGTRGNFIVDVVRKYFRRFPVELPHEDEPTKETLAAIDDDADEEDERLKEDEMLKSLSADEVVKRKKVMQQRREVHIDP